MQQKILHEGWHRVLKVAPRLWAAERRRCYCSWAELKKGGCFSVWFRFLRKYLWYVHSKRWWQSQSLLRHLNRRVLSRESAEVHSKSCLCQTLQGRGLTGGRGERCDWSECGETPASVCRRHRQFQPPIINLSGQRWALECICLRVTSTNKAVMLKRTF